MTAALRYSLFAFALGAALMSAVLLGRPAHATESTIEACFKPSNGTLYLLGGGSGRTACQPGDIPISWNTAGVNGQDGVSVTSERARRRRRPRLSQRRQQVHLGERRHLCLQRHQRHQRAGRRGFRRLLHEPERAVQPERRQRRRERSKARPSPVESFSTAPAIRLRRPTSDPSKLQTSVNSLEALTNLSLDAAADPQRARNPAPH